MRKKDSRPLSESQIQKLCVEWFRRMYPTLERMFFAVGNGGKRNVWTAKIMKDEGVRAGVADLILLIPLGGYASLCIEMKTPIGTQSKEQKEFQKACKEYKSKYVICHSLEEFQREVKEYIGE